MCLSILAKPVGQSKVRQLLTWIRILVKPYGYFNQNLTHVASIKYYLLRAFPENLKQLSLILTNMLTRRFEATYIIQFGM